MTPLTEMIDRRLLGRIEPLREMALRTVERAHWVALLLARLSVGFLFMSTGWGKVHDLPKVISFFVSLGIPAPAFNAVLVSYSELICGSLLVIGLLTRLATIPLLVSMVVAILTAKRSELHWATLPFDLAGFDEFTYLCMLVVIAVFGPGVASLDAVLLFFLGVAPRKTIAT
jgi:putative oxidoreductase